MAKHTVSLSNGESSVTWDVSDLWEAASNLPTVKVKIESLNKLVETKHKQFNDDDYERSGESDTSYPILLNSTKTKVLDGVHRLYKLKEEGVETVDCKLMRKMPKPIRTSGPPFKIDGLVFTWPNDKLANESFYNVPSWLTW